ISFYTFQGLSYTVDVYRGSLRAERSFPRFALYIIFFPQLVAGPIERATHLLPQFTRDHRWDGARVRRGLELCLWGLFKKVVIADRLAVYVDGVYDRPGAHVSATLLLATYAFAYQIYCDFSGYSDIAVGSARVLGFELMENFDRPYLATSLRDFWRRWHISLSTWLRDYLYVPLGGGRGSDLLTYRNLLLTMLLGGLWHGASLNFVVWGALHGAMLAVSRATLDARDRLAARAGVPVWLRDLVRTVLCFHLVCFAWIFFRASTWADSWTVIRGILRADGEAPFLHVMTFGHAGLGLLVLGASELLRQRPGLMERLRGHGALRLSATYALLLGVVLLGAESGAQFIYFQF
ncbi:MAG: MBOAT family protein, partial [Deltaproteobacteria bacterium]|nr:MBOAT family protein [Deltaproteobacteria bacterium]